MSKRTHFFGQPVYGQFINCLDNHTIVKQNENTLPLSIGHEDLNFSQTTSV